MFNAVLLTYLGLIAGRVLVIYRNGEGLGACADLDTGMSHLSPTLPRSPRPSTLPRSFSPTRALTHAYACHHICFHFRGRSEATVDRLGRRTLHDWWSLMWLFHERRRHPSEQEPVVDLVRLRLRRRRLLAAAPVPRGC
jgi:hypothetical protein